MKRVFFPLLMMLAAATNLTAQDEGLTKTVEVSRAYEPTIPNAYKINPIPRIDDTTKVATTFTYPLRQTKPITDSYLTNPIPPARIQHERYNKSEERNSGYVRVGLGVKTTTLLDAYYGSQRGKDFLWDVYANHYGNYGDVKNEAKEKVPTLDMRNEFGASGQYNFAKGVLYANAGFHRHDVRMYGYDTKSFTLNDYKALPNDEKRQYYNTTFASVKYDGYGQLDSAWKFGGKFNFYDCRNRYPQAEDALEFNLHAGRSITPTTMVGMELNTNIYMRNSELAPSNNTVVSLLPQAIERRENWEASAKLNLTFDNFSGDVKTYFYPVLNFTALLNDGLFLPYVEVSGDHQINNFKTITTENPYITPDIQQKLRNTQKAISFKGGIKGHIGSMFSYDLELAYAFVNDMYFYATDTVHDQYNLGNQLDILYDDVKLFTFKGGVRVLPSSALELRLWLEYNKYTMDKLPVAYNRPSTSVQMKVNYNLWKKLYMYARPSLLGSYKARDFEGNEVKRGLGFDLSLGADYQFENRSSVFLQLNNVTVSRYQVYNNYPTYGINVMLGYSFLF